MQYAVKCLTYSLSVVIENATKGSKLQTEPTEILRAIRSWSTIQRKLAIAPGNLFVFFSIKSSRNILSFLSEVYFFILLVDLTSGKGSKSQFICTSRKLIICLWQEGKCQGHKVNNLLNHWLHFRPFSKRIIAKSTYNRRL